MQSGQFFTTAAKLIKSLNITTILAQVGPAYKLGEGYNNFSGNKVTELFMRVGNYTKRQSVTTTFQQILFQWSSPRLKQRHVTV